MSVWLKDQLKQRIQADEGSFSEALGDISEVIYSKDISGLSAIFVFIILSGISVIAKALAVSRIEIKSNVSVNAAVVMRIINLSAEFFKK